MIFCFSDSTAQRLSLSDYSDISNVVIAALGLLLTAYVFLYQRGKDKRDAAAQQQKEHDDRIEATMLQEQNIRLQWFKELVVQPHLPDINRFYAKLHDIDQLIVENPLSENRRQQISELVKQEQAMLRKKFVDVLRGVNTQLYNDVIANLDTLIGAITITLFDDGFNLTHKPTFEREIGSKITYSRNDLIRLIYSYKGL